MAKFKEISGELRSELVHGNALRVSQNIRAGDYDDLSFTDAFERLHEDTCRHTRNVPPRDRSSRIEGTLEALESDFREMLQLRVDDNNGIWPAEASRERFAEMMADFYTKALNNKYAAYGAETYITVLKFIELVAHRLSHETGHEVTVELPKANLSDLSVLKDVPSGKATQEQVRAVFAKLSDPEESVCLNLLRDEVSFNQRPEWNIKQESPQLREDQRLLRHQEDKATMGDSRRIVTAEGTWVSFRDVVASIEAQLEADGLKKHFVDEDGNLQLRHVPGKYLSVPRNDQIRDDYGNVVRMKGLPELTSDFIDYGAVTHPDPGRVKLLNLYGNLYDGTDLRRDAGRKKPDKHRMEEAEKALRSWAERYLDNNYIPQDLTQVEAPKYITTSGGTSMGKSTVTRGIPQKIGRKLLVEFDRDDRRHDMFIYEVGTHKETQEHQTDYRYGHRMGTRQVQVLAEVMKERMTKDFYEILMRENKLDEAEIDAIRERVEKSPNMIKELRAVAAEYDNTEALLTSAKVYNFMRPGSNPDMKQLYEFEHMGYQTKIKIVEADIEEGMGWALKRLEEEHRIVGAKNAAAMGIRAMRNFLDHITDPKVHEVEFYSNGGGMNGKLIAETKTIDPGSAGYAASNDREVLKLGDAGNGKTKVLVVYDKRVVKHLKDQRRYTVDDKADKTGETALEAYRNYTRPHGHHDVGLSHAREAMVNPLLNLGRDQGRTA